MPLLIRVRSVWTKSVQKMVSTMHWIHRRCQHFLLEHPLGHALEHVSDVTSQFILMTSQLLIVVASMFLTMCSYFVSLISLKLLGSTLILIAKGTLGLCGYGLVTPGVNILGLVAQSAQFAALAALGFSGALFGLKHLPGRFDEFYFSSVRFHAYVELALSAATQTASEYKALIKNYFFPNQAPAPHFEDNRPAIESEVNSSQNLNNHRTGFRLSQFQRYQIADASQLIARSGLNIHDASPELQEALSEIRANQAAPR